jgi:hypothetical protein
MQANAMNAQPGTLTHALVHQQQLQQTQQTNLAIDDEDEDSPDPYAPQDVYEQSAPPATTNQHGREHVRGGGRRFGGEGMDSAALREIMAEGNNASNAFRRLIEGMFTRQSETSNNAQGFANAGILENFLLNGGAVEVDSETQSQAQALLDSYFSVEATAGRIMGFAVAVTGGDLDNNPWVEQAVRMGFGNATRLWGGDLPSISQQTYDAVNNAFEEWRTNGADAIGILNN